MQRKALQRLLGGAFAAVSVLATQAAFAREIYPGAIADAADMVCVPQCNLCHTSNPGTASTWGQKKLPLALVGNIKPLGTVDGLTAAWKLYAADPANATAVAAIKAGEDPEYGGSVCGPSYGCGAHVAKRPQRKNDREVVGWVVGLAALAAALRFRRRR